MAGVSRGTVSMVINGMTGGRIPISDETRRKVLEAMEKLGYSPNPAAQILAGGRNHLIGVFTYEPFFPYERDNFYYPFLLGIERQASFEGYNLLLITRTHGNEEPSIFKDGVNQLGLPDGSILLGARPNQQEILTLVNEGIPFVYIGRREIEGCEIDWVSPDYIKAGAESVRHLVELGHRRIGFLGRVVSFEPYQDKLEGCRQGAAEAQGVEMVELTEQLKGQNPDAWIRTFREQGFSAVITDNVDYYEAIIRGAHEAGLQTPRDLSVVCLTDVEDDFRDPIIRPTAVRLNRTRVGEEAVKLLLWRLDNPDAPRRHIRVPSELFIGESTAAAPSP